MSAMRRRSTVSTRRGDAGMTLIELIVAMGIFVVVIAVFMSGVVSMTKSTARAQAVSDATSSARKILDRFDKQVRYATQVNSPGAGSTAGTYYVEYLMQAQTAGATPICVQWRYSSAAHTMSVRSWTNSMGVVPSAWLTVATDVRNDLTSATPNYPFVFTFASTSNVHQKLEVKLDLGKGSRPGASIATTYVARNTSTSTDTNRDLEPNGVTDNPVCRTGAPRS